MQSFDKFSETVNILIRTTVEKLNCTLKLFQNEFDDEFETSVYEPTNLNANLLNVKMQNVDDLIIEEVLKFRNFVESVELKPKVNRFHLLTRQFFVEKKLILGFTLRSDRYFTVAIICRYDIKCE